MSIDYGSMTQQKYTRYSWRYDKLPKLYSSQLHAALHFMPTKAPYYGQFGALDVVPFPCLRGYHSRAVFWQKYRNYRIYLIYIRRWFRCVVGLYYLLSKSRRSMI